MIHRRHGFGPKLRDVGRVGVDTRFHNVSAHVRHKIPRRYSNREDRRQLEIMRLEFKTEAGLKIGAWVFVFKAVRLDEITLGEDTDSKKSSKEGPSEISPAPTPASTTGWG